MLCVLFSIVVIAIIVVAAKTSQTSTDYTPRKKKPRGITMYIGQPELCESAKRIQDELARERIEFYREFRERYDREHADELKGLSKEDPAYKEYISVRDRACIMAHADKSIAESNEARRRAEEILKNK